MPKVKGKPIIYDNGHKFLIVGNQDDKKLVIFIPQAVSLI